MDAPAGDEPRSAREVERLVDTLTRRERGRLLAGLVRRLGSHQLDLAEDVAQDALLAALATWPYEGIPRNPAAWLTRVAGNKALDRLRRMRLERERLADISCEPLTADPPAATIDPDLHLILLSSHPALEAADQVALTLRIVAGFTAREIADAMLSTPAAIDQRLSRSRKRLRGLPPEALTALPTDADSRIQAGLKTVYLLFSLGYAPRRGSQLIRRDVTTEALRLARCLAAPPAGSGEAHALAALLCLQSSRLDAREDAHGRPILLKDQDRARWSRALVDEGLRFLALAHESGGQPGRYHLEAGIAACHAMAPAWERTDWPSILRCYGGLERLTGSPVVTINRCVAQAFGDDPETALADLEDLRDDPRVADYAPYHIARAEILRLLGRDHLARDPYHRAIESGVSAPVLTHLEGRLATSL